MKKLFLLFIISTTILFSQNYWKVISNRLTPLQPAYGLDLRSGIYGTTGLRLGYSNQADSGTVRYNAGIISYFNGSSWLNLSTGSGGGSTFYWNKSGGTPTTDSVRFIQGSNVVLTQSGNTLTIASSGGGGGDLWENDVDDDLQPIIGVAISSRWELDADDDLQPVL